MEDATRCAACERIAVACCTGCGRYFCLRHLQVIRLKAREGERRGSVRVYCEPCLVLLTGGEGSIVL